MAGNRRRQYDPYYDLNSEAGQMNFMRLSIAEVRTMADNHAKDARYRRIRRAAVQFFETHYAEHSFDALVPYMAMTFVDRFHLNGKIPTIVESTSDNLNLFLTCCLTLSWKLRTKRLLLTQFLARQRLDRFFSVENVIEMESYICRHLSWRLRPVMPFWFLDFFTPFLTLPSGSSLVLRPVYQLIVKSQFDITFTQFRPSVMAASAMLIFTSKEFPNQVDAFESSVIKSDFLEAHEGMILKCQMMLEPLYIGRSRVISGPPRFPPIGAYSSTAPIQSDPIPITKATRRQSTSDDEDEGDVDDANIDDEEEPPHCESEETFNVDDEEEPLPREAEETSNVGNEEEPPRREGKETASVDDQGKETGYDDDDDEEPPRREGKQTATVDDQGMETGGDDDEEEPPHCEGKQTANVDDQGEEIGDDDDYEEEPPRCEGKQTAIVDDQGMETSDDDYEEEPPRREGKQTAIVDDQGMETGDEDYEEVPPPREGKEIAAEVIIPQLEDWSRAREGEDYVADLMMFALGWKDAQIEAAERDDDSLTPSSGVGIATYLAERISCCCGIL